VLDTQDLAQVVPGLGPEALHRVVETCGLEECSELLALATPEQLAGVLDLDLWRAPTPGLDEQFDADRFGEWLEALCETGADLAAAIVVKMEPDLVSAALAQYGRVFDCGAIDDVHPLPEGLVTELGGYFLVSTREDSLDAITAVLTALNADHTDYFHRVMTGVRALSDSAPEIDGCDNLLGVRDQLAFDLADSRTMRRDQQGYVSPAEARAFLQQSRGCRPKRRPPATRVAGRALETRQPLSQIQRLLLFIQDSHPAAFSERSGELAFLANTLVAGCSIQARALTPQEASEAVAAVCNLGVENWPAPVTDDLLTTQKLTDIFQAGWSILHHDVCMEAAEQLVATLGDMESVVDEETQAGLDALRKLLTRAWRAGIPWQAREAMDVLAILDMPAWAALLGLIDELPVMHAAMSQSNVRTIDAHAFTFISQNRHVTAVRAFLLALRKTLGVG